MISKKDILKKAMVPWNSGNFLRTQVLPNAKTVFPIEIRFRTPGGKFLLENFEMVRTWIHEIRSDSREDQPKGYDILWKKIAHRNLGEQQLPWRLVFRSAEDWLFFIKRERKAAQFSALAAYTRDYLPELTGYLAEYPLKALALADDWSALIRVCQWFKAHPDPGVYIRELDIPGVDTKFIESRKSSLMALLPRVLDAGGSQTSITGLSRHGFERKFCLKYDPPLVRFRMLDPVRRRKGFSDLSVPVGQLACTPLEVDRIFITENKINGLSFPELSQSMVIFGLGYGVDMLAEISWMASCEIIYWGDIDTHGFSILSMLRGQFPTVQSMLMDRDTLMAHKELWGSEEKDKRHTGDLHHLTPHELELFRELKQNIHGTHVRLEQERIRFSFLVTHLKKISKREK